MTPGSFTGSQREKYAMNIYFASSAWVWVLCSNAQAAIINVPGDQPDIQTAINVAVNGDEIIVSPGRYVAVWMSG